MACSSVLLDIQQNLMDQTLYSYREYKGTDIKEISLLPMISESSNRTYHQRGQSHAVSANLKVSTGYYERSAGGWNTRIIILGQRGSVLRGVMSNMKKIVHIRSKAKVMVTKEDRLGDEGGKD